jgi:hypothetical protein
LADFIFALKPRISRNAKRAEQCCDLFVRRALLNRSFRWVSDLEKVGNAF